MRFVSVRELRGKSAAIWRELAQEQEMVITSNGKPIALLAATSEELLEESLDTLRSAPRPSCRQRYGANVHKAGYGSTLCRCCRGRGQGRA